jgi:hypothetical protein
MTAGKILQITKPPLLLTNPIIVTIQDLIEVKPLGYIFPKVENFKLFDPTPHKVIAILLVNNHDMIF